MSSSSSADADAAAAAKMAAHLGLTDMNASEISEMLQLKQVLFPMFQVCIAFLVLAWFSVSLRVYARAVVLKSFGADDWLMLLTLAVFTTCCATLLAIEGIERSDAASEAVAQGLIAQLPMMQQIFRLVLAFMAMYITTTVVLKLSLAIFFLRVIPHGWQRKVLYIATAIYTAYGTAFTFIIIFQCGNPHDFFINEAQGKCIPDTILQPLYYTAGAMNALTDWIFSILPVTVLWSAAIPRSTKISAGCLLGLGSLASISSLIRLAYIPGIRASPTFLAHAVNIASWSIVEPGLGIVAASLATLRPLYRYCFPGKRNSARKGRPTLRQGDLDYDIVFGAEGFGTTTFICADCHDTPTKTHGLDDEKCGSLAPRGRGRSIPIYPKYDSSEDYIKATTVTSQDSSSTYDQFPTPPKQDKQTQRCSKVNEV